MVGAALAGGSLVGLAVSHAWIATSAAPPHPTGIPLPLVTLNAALYLLVALGMHLMVAEDMTYELRVTNRRLSSAQAELRALAITDELTGCYNRRHFQQTLVRELKRHRRYNLPLSLLFIDIDRFKAINDRLGHAMGDRVIRLVADLLVRHVREVDYVFRWGGDEFVVLLSCDRSHAVLKAEEIKEDCQRVTRELGLLDGVTLSIGCGYADVDAENPRALLQAADEEMYRDKAQRRSAGQGTRRRRTSAV
jgi:diguanylate cyclase (GGDEF)-like protein